VLLSFRGYFQSIFSFRKIEKGKRPLLFGDFSYCQSLGRLSLADAGERKIERELLYGIRKPLGLDEITIETLVSSFGIFSSKSLCLIQKFAARGF